MTEPWWEGFYDENLAAALLDPAQGEEAAATADFLVDALQLQPGYLVFDQCCGTGRLSHALARRGCAVTGIDLAASYIERALRDAPPAGPALHFERADAFHYVARPPCHAVINWWTSFGYAATDEDNLRMLARAFESLKPGGRFALDFMNASQIYRHFQPEVVTRCSTPGGELTLVRESEIDLPTNTLRKIWRYQLPSGDTVVRPSSVRLYDPATLGRLLLTAGFETPHFYGNITREPLSLDSPRCILVARKP